MHLVKWIRKNMSKLMAIFVIVIMIAFIMPSVLTQLSKPRQSSQTNAVWLYDKDKKITTTDLRQASVDLTVLRELFADKLLLTQQDIRLILLGQLLFPESEKGALLSDELKKVALQNRMYISPSKIDDFFAQARGKAEVFFIVLKNEAARAGCVVPPQQAGDVLNSIVPQLTNNQISAADLVKRVCSANGMSDEQGLAAFADVLSIMTYTRIVGDTEDVTESQLENIYARAKEKIDVNYVQFSADNFLDKAPQPSQEQITAQFEKYKDVLPGSFSDENPCGFGYKIGPRVALDYMIIKLDDLKKNIKVPTEEEVEEYYQQNLENPPITIEVPDPNDPNSKIKKQRSYAEVANMIRQGLYVRKIDSQATKILSQAIDQTDAGFESLDYEKSDVEKFKSLAGDYNSTAQKLSKEYDVNVYTGRTSLLTSEDIQSERYLGGLAMTGQSRIPTRLAKLVFAVKQLGGEASKLGPFEPLPPKMFVSVGPLSDMGSDVMAIVRVVETSQLQMPPNIDFSYQKNLPQIGDKASAENNKYVLKNTVTKDCKRLESLQTAQKAADDFVQMIKKQSWDSALDKINAAYGKKDVNEPNAKTFAVQSMNSLGRVSQTDIEMTKMRVAGMTGAENIVNQSIAYGKLINAFYNKYQEMQAKKEKPPVIIGFKPRFSSYVIKDLKVESVGNVEDYEKVRQQLAFEQDFINSQSMAIDFLLPDSIIKRTNLKQVKEPNKPAEANEANGEAK